MKQEIERAVAILQAGGLVAIPTETVYGLGADATNVDALRRIFQAKQRPEDHPLIVHLSEPSQLSSWVREVPDVAWQLAKAFWPGPLTLIMKKADSVLDLVTGGQDTIGIRIPSHPIAQALLRSFGGGIAAPSANRFGRISPTTADAVREELGDADVFILDGGASDIGLESTIVDVSGTEVVVLRPGMIGVAEIEAVLHRSITSGIQKKSPRVSGSLESHYAPVTPTRLVETGLIPGFLNQLTHRELPVAVMGWTPVNYPEVLWMKMPKNAKAYAHDMYQALRYLDKQHLKTILIEEVPRDVSWDAIRDRLGRASSSVRQD